MTKDILEPVVSYFLDMNNEPIFGAEVYRSMTEFLGDRGPLPEVAWPYFLDWFLFDFVIFGKETPIEYFTRSNPLNFSAERISTYKSIRRGHKFDFFEVTKNKKGDVLMVQSVHGRENYKIHDKYASFLPLRGGVIVCRIIPSGDKYLVASIAPIIMDEPTPRDRTRMLTMFPVVNPLVIYKKMIERDNVGSGFVMEHVGEDSAFITGGSPEHGSDGCPICVLMDEVRKEGRAPTEAELARVFAEANHLSERSLKRKREKH